MPLSTQQLHDLAKHGARARIAELEAELSEIRAEFPDAAPARRGRKSGRPVASRATDVPSPRTRRPVSAAARKRMSDAQKKRWALQRAATKK